MPTDLPPVQRSASIRATLLGARADLLSGRGPGASEAEVAAHTRNRVQIAGVPQTRRLELAARQTARARGDADAIADVIQLDRADAVMVAEPLRPGHLAHATLPRARLARLVFAAAAAVVVRALSRHRPQQP